MIQVSTPLLTAQWLGSGVEHSAAMEIMRAQAEAVANDDAPETVLYVEHAPVLTIGRATAPADIAHVPSSLPIVEVNRGGQATFHGPGQLVAYPILNLKRRADDRAPDLHAYLRTMEEAVMRVVERRFALPCERREEFTGVWTPGYPQAARPGIIRKICAMGVSCRRWITGHGLCLNLHPDLVWFSRFTPCGITDAETSSVAEEARRADRPYDAVNNSPAELMPLMHAALIECLAEAGWTRHPLP